VGVPRSAGRLPLSAGMKTYIDMKGDAIEEQKKSLEAGLRAMDLRIELSDDTIAGAPINEAWVQTMKSMNELDQESRRHAERAAKLHKNAKEYYKSKDLGS
jgi:hypothetical protein